MLIPVVSLKIHVEVVLECCSKTIFFQPQAYHQKGGYEMGRQHILITQSFNATVETIFNIHKRWVEGSGRAVRKAVMDPEYNVQLL